LDFEAFRFLDRGVVAPHQNPTLLCKGRNHGGRRSKSHTEGNIHFKNTKKGKQQCMFVPAGVKATHWRK